MHELSGRIRNGGLAVLFTLAAAVSMLLLSRVTVISNSDHTLLYQFTSWIFFAASVGPLLRYLRPFCEIFVWNASGWSIALAVLGLDTVGAMPMWPIMLAALGLTFWPREPGEQLPVSVISIAIVGGMIACWLLWAQPDLPALDTWLEGL